MRLSTRLGGDRQEDPKIKVRGVVQDTIYYVKEGMAEMVQTWRAHAAGGIEWERERVQKVEWLRLVVRAWRSEVVRDGREDEHDAHTCTQAATG